MSNQKARINPLTAAVGVAFASSIAVGTASAADNPFELSDLDAGYMVAGGDKHKGEGKCGEGKCGGDKAEGEGKCGEGKCGEAKDEGEGKCGEGKCGEAKDEGEDNSGEGKCRGAA